MSNYIKPNKFSHIKKQPPAYDIYNSIHPLIGREIKFKTLTINEYRRIMRELKELEYYKKMCKFYQHKNSELLEETLKLDGELTLLKSFMEDKENKNEIN